MIKIENLFAGYGSEDILKDISTGFYGGEFIGILGRNGSGKTTLLKTISRVLDYRCGKIELFQKPLESYSPKEIAGKLSVVPQETLINFDYSVYDIIMMGRYPHMKRFSGETAVDRRIVDEVMEKTNVSRYRNKSVTEISGGERQRVLIARALAQQPQILLLDEATSHLDINHQIEILNLIKNLDDKVTRIAIFHDLNLASQYCDRLIIMNEGKIVAGGKPESVLTRENLALYFGIEAFVEKNNLSGKPYIRPLINPLKKFSSVEKVHIVCGGGTGSDLMQMLKGAAFNISAGILCAGDTDYKTAKELLIDTLCVPPFTEITENNIASLKDMIEKSDAVILTMMPVGPGNICNIEALRDINKPVFIFQPSSMDISCYDFCEGRFADQLMYLIENGAKVVKSINELSDSLSQKYTE
ncbi:ABC transporter ATP-binding protein [Methanoplanus sp. FWC-SCC4]|uniref:Cobalamin import ATP-binding protein BtuD n=1 Tax=Methanochimaera problematica TaxID=2609417 RepID=A0AA97I342_9EURY|nr:ABC transporter ATP-binding protein [Methanoplanus sp. FWC-SCC4]WOF15491.1 ABC transporter ATP-binding protein [Methanoplanus sp. FWC-SCC4]